MENSTPNKSHKKRNWIVIVCIVVFVALALIAFVSYASKVLTSVVNDRLRAQTASIDGSFSYGDLKVDLWRASVYVNDLKYVSDSTGLLSKERPGYQIDIKEAKFIFLRYFAYLIKKDVKIGEVRLSDVSSVIVLPPKAAKDSVRDKNNAVSDTVSSHSTIGMSKKVLEFVASVNVNKVSVENASLKLQEVDSKLDLSFDSLNLHVRNLGYDLSKDTLTYNDSVYECSFSNLKFIQPDGKYTLTVKSFNTKDAEGININGIRHVCNVSKEKLAIVNGKVPVIWSDLSLNNISTTDVNIVRSVISGYVKLDTIKVEGGNVVLYRDNTYPPVHVNRPFQVLLGRISIPLDVRTLILKLNTFTYTQKEANMSPAAIGMNNLSLSAHRISNIDNRDLVALMSTSINNGGGFMTLNLRLLKDTASTWRCRMFIENSKMEAFNPFIQKLSGANVSGNLKRLEGYFTGDTLNAKGEFVMEYSDLDAKIIKGQSPIPQLNKYANTINGIIKLMLPHSNPLKPGYKPKAFKVDAKRNLYKPYFVYILSPMFCGIKETMLHGVFLDKEIHSSEHINIGDGGKSARQAYKDSVKAERDSVKAEKKAAKEAAKETKSKKGK